MEIGQEIIWKLPSDVYIYGLCNPADKVIRYVGQTDNPMGRLEAHCRDGVRYRKEGSGTLVKLWLGMLIDDGIVPILVILDITTRDQAFKREREWINKIQDLQGNLVNSHLGFHTTA